MPSFPTALDRGYEQEVHFDNVRQLTYGGDNAEAYWSFDGRSLVFQATNPGWGTECDQIYVMDLSDGTPSSTPLHRSAPAWDAPPAPTSCRATRSVCMPPPTRPIRLVQKHRDGGPNNEYVWPIYAGYDIYTAPIGGGEPTLLIGGEGYDAEAHHEPQGRQNCLYQHPRRRLWTSTRATLTAATSSASPTNSATTAVPFSARTESTSSGAPAAQNWANP